MKRTELVVLVCILAIAAGMRLYALDRIPPGLYPDEAVNGTDAQEARDSGTFKLFYPNNNGREGLFINLQALSIHFFGNTIFALRFVSALAGVLTVLGVYLLCRRMFDSWELAAMAAFMMATGFWHVNFSRIGFQVILAPLWATWGFYYLYKGIETHRLWHWALAGVLLGLGFHSYIAFRVMPLAIAPVLLAYWWGLWRTFRDGKYAYARHQMLVGVCTMLAAMMIVLLPIAEYFTSNPQDFTDPTQRVAVWNSDHPIRDFARSTALTVGMLFVHGDTNWRHNISGSPALLWPVAALAAAGLVHTLWRLLHSLRMRGHPGIVQTLLLSWLLVGLLPGILSTQGIPNALETLIAAPPAYILAAVGLHWLHVWLEKWYRERDRHPRESALATGLAVISLLIAFGIADAQRYFIQWAREPRVAEEFYARYLPIAARINLLPPAVLKFVVVSRGDVLIDGIPVSARTIMYLTDTGTMAKQQLRHVTYVTPDQLKQTRVPSGSVVIALDP